MIQKYKLIAIVFILILASCKSKKTITDITKESKSNTETLITESNNQRSLITETEQKRESKTQVDKTIFEEWMSIKSDVAVIEDKDGNKWTFTNPEIAKNQKQSNDFILNRQNTEETVRVSQTEENAQSESKENIKEQTNLDFHEETESKPKNQFLLWIISVTFFGTVIFVALRWFRLL